MFAPTVLAAQYAGTFELFDTTRVDARAVQPAPIVSNPNPGRDIISGDIITTGTARLRVAGRRWSWSLAYSPNITIPAVELSLAPQVLQTANMSVAWTGRFVSLTASEVASYGRLSTAFLYQPTPTTPAVTTGTTSTPGQTTPPVVMTGAPNSTGLPTALQSSTTPVTGIDYGSTTSFGALSIQVARHVSTSVSGGYTFNGGLRTDSQAYLPDQYGPFANLLISYAPTREDSFGTLFNAQGTQTFGVCPGVVPGQFSIQDTPLCREYTPVAQTQELVRHQLTETTVLTFGAGVAASVVQATFTKEAVIVPVATASYTQALGIRGSSSLVISSGLAPTVDIRTGLLSNRVQATGAFTKAITSTVQLVGTLGWLQSVPLTSDPFPIVTLSGTFESRVRVDRDVDVALGLQEFWAAQRSYPSFASTIGYASVVLHPHPWHL